MQMRVAVLSSRARPVTESRRWAALVIDRRACMAWAIAGAEKKHSAAHGHEEEACACRGAKGEE